MFHASCYLSLLRMLDFIPIHPYVEELKSGGVIELTNPDSSVTATIATSQQAQDGWQRTHAQARLSNPTVLYKRCRRHACAPPSPVDSSVTPVESIPGKQGEFVAAAPVSNLLSVSCSCPTNNTENRPSLCLSMMC